MIGNDEFKPTEYSSCVLWLRSDLGITLNSGNVSNWEDQSIFNNDPAHSPVQTTGANQPAYNIVDPFFGNKPSLSFNGTSQFLLGGTWQNALAQPYTIITVGKNAGTGGAVQVITENLSSNGAQMSENSGTFQSYAGSLVSDGSGANSLVPFIFGCTFATSGQMFVNQKTPQASASIGTNGATGFSIGSLSSGADYWSGQIVEIIVYNQALNNGQISTIVQYLGQRYNIAIGS